MTSAFAFFRRSDSPPAGAAPVWLYRSEAFVEDLELMPAPQAVRRQAASGAGAGINRPGRLHNITRPMPADLRWSAAPTA